MAPSGKIRPVPAANAANDEAAGAAQASAPPTDPAAGRNQPNSEPPAADEAAESAKPAKPAKQPSTPYVRAIKRWKYHVQRARQKGLPEPPRPFPPKKRGPKPQPKPPRQAKPPRPASQQKGPKGRSVRSAKLPPPPDLGDLPSQPGEAAASLDPPACLTSGARDFWPAIARCAAMGDRARASSWLEMVQLAEALSLQRELAAKPMYDLQADEKWNGGKGKEVPSAAWNQLVKVEARIDKLMKSLGLTGESTPRPQSGPGGQAASAGSVYPLAGQVGPVGQAGPLFGGSGLGPELDAALNPPRPADDGDLGFLDA